MHTHMHMDVDVHMPMHLCSMATMPVAYPMPALGLQTAALRRELRRSLGGECCPTRTPNLTFTSNLNPDASSETETETETDLETDPETDPNSDQASLGEHYAKQPLEQATPYIACKHRIAQSTA